MSAKPGREERWVEYLLGGLSPEEREQVEEAVFTDDDAEQELQAAADDLIHAYQAGALSAADRSRLEAHFMNTTRGRQRLAFIRDLLSAVDRVSPGAVALPTPSPIVTSPARWRPWAAAAAALLATAALLAAVLLRPSRPGTEVASVPAATRAQPAVTAVPPSTPIARGSAVHVVRLPRAAPKQAVVDIPLTADTGTVRLELPVDEEGPPSYDVGLRTADGREVWHAEELSPSGSGEPLVLLVPARLLRGDDYRLVVRGETLRGAPSPVPTAREIRLRILRSR